MVAIESSFDCSSSVQFFITLIEENVSSRLAVRTTFGQETVNAPNPAMETSMPLDCEGVK